MRRIVVTYLALVALLLSAWQAWPGGFPTLLGVGTPPVVAAGSCTASTNFLARTSLTGSDFTNYDTLICGLVTDGIITGNLSGARGCGSLLDVFYLLAAPNSTTALLNFCGTSYGGTANGSPNFSAYNGYLGVDASSTVYIDTGFNPTTATSPNFVQNSAHAGVCTLTIVASGPSGGAAIGLVSGTTGTRLFPRYNDNKLYADINDSSQNAGIGTANLAGLYLINRSASNATQTYYPNTNTPLTTTSTAPANGNFKVLNNGTDTGGAYRIAATTIGASLSSTNVTNIHNRLSTYMTAVGTGGC